MNLIDVGCDFHLGPIHSQSIGLGNAMQRDEFLSSFPLIASIGHLSSIPVADHFAALDSALDPTSDQFYVGGLGPIAVPFLRRGGPTWDKSVLQKAGSDITGELNAMFGSTTQPPNVANADITKMRVTLFPYWMNPRHTDPDHKLREMGPNRAKSYAVLRVTMTQATSLSTLSPTQLLSWGNAWNFVQNTANNRGDDVLAQPLPAAANWSNMPMPQGDGQFDVNFIVAIANQGTITLNNIVGAIAPFLVNSTTNPLTGVFPVEASSLSLVLSYENLVLSIAKQLMSGPQFTQILQPQTPITVSVHSQSTGAGGGTTLRLPAGRSYFAFVPATSAAGGSDDFESWIKEKAAAGKKVTIQDDGTPVIIDSSSNVVDQSDWNQWTIVTLGATVTLQT